MQTIIATETVLLEALRILSPQSSKTTLRSWIKDGRVAIDGKIAKISATPVLSGQKVTVGIKPRFAGGKLRLIYEDDHIVAIEKPEGLLSVATNFEKGETAHALLKLHYYPRHVHVVHRLDQDTSGVMLFALSDKGYEGLKELFERHDIQRSYSALVEGSLPQPYGTWESYLYEDNLYKVHSTLNPDRGRLAITHYRVFKTSPRYTRLDLTLETGRKNQIRVHCTDHGCPVAGDKKYGAITDPAQRLCLHARLIAFVHPVTGQPLEFNSPLPPFFERLLKN